MSVSLPLRDAAATAQLGIALAEGIAPFLNAIRTKGLQINLSGDLGAGKTEVVRAMLRQLGVTGTVKSPTFALLEPYTVSSLDFYHFDFYRLKDPAEFASTGFRDLFGPGRICAVEWPERAGPRLPAADISIVLRVEGDSRSATISADSVLGNECLKRAMEQIRLADGGSSPPASARSFS